MKNIFHRLIFQERMSLKHRGGSKYAKKQMIYAKYDNKVTNYLISVAKDNRKLIMFMFYIYKSAQTSF